MENVHLPLRRAYCTIFSTPSVVDVTLSSVSPSSRSLSGGTILHNDRERDGDAR